MEIAVEPIRKFCKVLIVLWMTVPSVSLASGVLSLEEASDLFSRTAHIFDMKISPDGEHFFVSASQDGDETASIFDMRTNELVHVINFDRGWKIGDNLSRAVAQMLAEALQDLCD